MIIITKKQGFSKNIYVPSDKSITQRAIIIGAFFCGIDLENPSLCLDCLSALDCVSSLGAEIKHDTTMLSISKIPNSHELIRVNAGNSATALRLMLGASAFRGISLEIDGDKSLKKRSLKNVIKCLKKMGADISARRLRCPVSINPSMLKPIKLEDCTSAQIKSAVILASLGLEGESIIYEKVKTRDHTERMLSYLGANIISTQDSVIVNPLKEPLKRKIISVKGDLSSAAFMLAHALLQPNGYVYISEVNLNPTRLSFIKYLIKRGASITIEKHGNLSNEPFGSITARHSTIKPFKISEEMTLELIDEIPILAVLAVFINGRSVFKGLSLLKNKESNRMKEIYKNLKKFNVDVKLKEDTLSIRGGKELEYNNKRVNIVSKDHRIIMAMAILASNALGCKIKYPDHVNISFPDFFSIL